MSIVYDTPLFAGGFFLSESRLKSGITTGTCAAAAAKAALMAWSGLAPTSAEVITPSGVWLTVPIESAAASAEGGRACVIKDAGDDPDITHGVRIISAVEIRHGRPEIVFAAGEGIGIVTLPGLQIPVG